MSEKFKPVKTMKYVLPSQMAGTEVELLQFEDGSICLIGIQESVIFEAGDNSLGSALKYLDKAGYRAI